MELAQANTVSPKKTELTSVSNWTSSTKLIRIEQTTVKAEIEMKKE
jgi:hypothetical protein